MRRIQGRSASVSGGTWSQVVLQLGLLLHLLGYASRNASHKGHVEVSTPHFLDKRHTDLIVIPDLVLHTGPVRRVLRCAL